MTDQNVAQAWVTHLLTMRLAPKPPRPRRELRRWESRTTPHTHQAERSKRLRQMKSIAAKPAAIRALARRGNLYPSARAVRREIRAFPHIYL